MRRRRWLRLSANVVGPDDFLVISTPKDLTWEQMQRLKDSVPEELHGRLLLVSSAESYVLSELPPQKGASA